MELNKNWNLDEIVQPTILDTEDPNIKQDILLLITQYLQEQGYHHSTMTILDESKLKISERLQEQHEIKRMKKAILMGDWPEVDRLCARPLMKNHKAFLYAAYEQQYLEYIEHHELQKAFTHLQKRLKPLEHLQRTRTEFRDLCYLLTTKSVQDTPSFKHWQGITASREKLVELFQSTIDFEFQEREQNYIPANRLTSLLQQAVAYQVECSRYHPNLKPKIQTLLSDYSCLVIPNSKKCQFLGHTKQVKCAEFVGDQGKLIITGSRYTF